MKPPLWKSTGDGSRISKLPHNVLDRILTFLPIKEAARTSVLSSKWRYQWRSIPHLVFDADFATFPKRYTCKLGERNKVMLQIYQALLVHQGPMHRFELAIPGMDHYPEIDQLISYLSTKSVKELNIFSTRGLFSEVLPSSVFSILNLNSLRLQRYKFQVPPPLVALFAALPALRQLKLGIELLLFLSNGHVPYKLPAASLTNLEVLEIPRLLLDSLPEARVLVCLIMSSPNLRRLTIHDDDDEDHPKFEPIDSLQMLLELKDDHHPGGVCCLQRLEEFSIHICHGDQVELDLARFVLATAPLLKTVFVKPTEGLPSEDAITYLVEMTQYKRISKEAEVKYMQLMSIDED
ncbi:F-box/FBD/LRR-repeat protein At1g13570 [Linum perenne]